jgi:hypothetical protein
MEHIEDNILAAHNFKHKHKRTRSSKVIMCGGGRYPCAVQKR